MGQLKDRFSDTRFHTYYQWTSATLCFQAFLSYVPRLIWKYFENGLQRNLAYDRKLRFYPISMIMEGDEMVDALENHKKHMEILVTYFKTHLGHHQAYFFTYCLCELLGFFCTIGNIFLINWLLLNQFFHYGPDVLSYWLYDRGPPLSKEISPMIKVFPRLTKCQPRRSLLVFEVLKIIKFI